MEVGGDLRPGSSYLNWLRTTPQQVVWLTIEAMMCEVVERLITMESEEESLDDAATVIVRPVPVFPYSACLVCACVSVL